MNIWDLLIILTVSGQVVASSYLYHPKWKALMMSLPFPFTFASLTVGQQINVVNIVSMIFMFLFMQSVRALYLHWRVPIIAAIFLSAAGYCLAGWITVQLVPVREDLFWISLVFVFVAAAVLMRLMPVREEPGDRTSLPVWLKIPLTVLLVVLLVWGKQALQGAITFFPMVSVFIAYEARKSLWTMGRQNTILIVAMIPMLATAHLMYGRYGLGLSLTAGWCVFLPVLGALRWMHARSKKITHTETVNQFS